jgi:hypothetical protein
MIAERTVEEYRDIVVRLIARCTRLVQLVHREHNGSRQWFDCEQSECLKTRKLLRDGEGSGE